MTSSEALPLLSLLWRGYRGMLELISFSQEKKDTLCWNLVRRQKQEDLSQPASARMSKETRRHSSRLDAMAGRLAEASSRRLLAISALEER